MKKFWNKVNALFSKAATWFKNLISSNDSFVQNVAPVAIDVVNWIKNFNNSKESDALVSLASLISNKYGAVVANSVKSWITNHIDEVLAGLNITLKAAQTASITEKVQKICEYVSSLDLDKFKKGECLTTLAANIANALSDSKLSFAEIVSIIEYIYKENV